MGISYVNVVSRQLYGPGRTGKCGGAPQSWSNHFSRQCSSSSTQCGKQEVLYICSITLEGKVDPIQPLFLDTPFLSLQLSILPKISYGSGQTTEIIVGDVDRV